MNEMGAVRMDANDAARATMPLTILVAALGGEGGGVLADWIVAAATAAGLPAQSTSVPGVAQRTGATSYYIEFLPVAPPAGAQPVFALVPMAGRVDVVVASELLEAARILERGFVTPARTTFIASSSRVFTTAEKMQMGDGRFDVQRIHDASKALARRYVSLDLDAMAAAAGTVVSAPMFGALAGAGAFVWPREVCEQVIRSGGRGVEASLKGFAAAYEAAREGAPRAAPAQGSEGVRAGLADAPPDLAHLPEGVRAVISHGIARCTDFQDEAYGEMFLERVRTLVSAARESSPQVATALEEAIRRLALWMAYEDIPRVADLKTRAERFERIRMDAQVVPGQVLQVSEFFKPGAAEIADMLPVSLGRRIMQRVEAGKGLPFTGRGMNVATTGVRGYLVMRMLAGMKRFRRGSLRYATEQAAIEDWLSLTCVALRSAPAVAGALAELPRLLKGYGETHARGRENYAAIMDTMVRPELARADVADDAGPLRRAIAAALADPDGKALDKALDRALAAATPAAEPRPDGATLH